MGDGSCIKIWGDNWLPRENYFKVFTPPPLPQLLEATVESLFLDGARTWNKILLHQLFSLEEVEVIQSIPLSIRRMSDRQVWHYEHNGIFLVKSAYYLAKRGGCWNVGFEFPRFVNQEEIMECLCSW